MHSPIRQFSCIMLGEQSLLIQCGEAVLEAGHLLLGVVAEDRQIASWCSARGIPHLSGIEDLRNDAAFDYLFSITNPKILPRWLIERPSRMAINFHDGPLPRYAGLNAPVWAMINGESEHGIAWHQMSGRTDSGPILVSRRFPIAQDDTAFSVNARCYEEGLTGFGQLLDKIHRDELVAHPQELSRRSYYGRSARPAAAGLLDWRQPAVKLQRLVRALDFGPYPNPVILPKVLLGERVLLAREAEVVVADELLTAGAIQSFTAETLTVRCAEDALKITRLTDDNGKPADLTAVLRRASPASGSRLPSLDAAQTDELTEQVSTAAKHETFWRDRLLGLEPADLPFGVPSRGPQRWLWQTLTPGDAHNTAEPVSLLMAAFTLLLARLTGKTSFSLGYVPNAIASQLHWLGLFFSPVVPLPVALVGSDPFVLHSRRVADSIAQSEEKLSFLNDLPAREPRIGGIIDCAALPVRIARSDRFDEETARALAGGAALTVLVSNDGERLGFLADDRYIDETGLSRLLDCFQVLLPQVISNPERLISEFDLLSEEDHRQLNSFKGSSAEKDDFISGNTIHELFERQAALTPDRQACIFNGRSLTYRELNDAANRLARHLRSVGIARGDLVGVMVERSLEMLISLYAIHKAGAAYVPLDPDYPPERLRYMIEDAALRTVITRREYQHLAPVTDPVVLELLGDMLNELPCSNLGQACAPDDLAYVIYTSGSTGKPKGVMVEHRNVTNFFEGIDQHIDVRQGVWLAVTSISFDISVLELFWTLTRGFTVVLYSGSIRSGTQRRNSIEGGNPVEFGLFYWNVATDDPGDQRNGYRLLLDGARFADTHGFNAVWNPERHFEAFGGLFPNPSVTCAALATITTNVSLRAGSCVVPLHSPIRIAEEWAVVDNLSNGRVGISIAAGWAPPDFAIKPENFANAKQVMFESVEIVRRLWRGEAVRFPGPDGNIEVRTRPRPVQKELPLWVTTAGNIDTFIEAGKAGTNLLTHLLGQSLEDVGLKIHAYRSAREAAGHPGRGVVSLMLHTFVGPDRDSVSQIVREPLKKYLESAMYLVKAAAWQFPTFKKLSEQQGKTLDDFFANISPEDKDGLLEFAFERYFNTSGLFGTPESCLEMVASVQEIDIDEIACLIDFGIDTDVVLEHLPYLDELRQAARTLPREREREGDGHAISELFLRHGITHLQCTPSMAAMLLGDKESERGLETLHHMMVGGEALPVDLARSLVDCVGGRVTNLYGPTETTIWSAAEEITGDKLSATAYAPIGRPLQNQQMYILDHDQKPLPPGLPGELVVGGEGVARGYWNQPLVTAEQFVPDPFSAAGKRIYRTGDVARYLSDGRIEYLERLDQQIKIRGYRVELGEIESLLRAHEAVRDAVVLSREDKPGDKRLVAYVTAGRDHESRKSALKEWLERQLPNYMVPSEYVILDELPLTPNGKVDRRSLAALSKREFPSAYTPPRSEAEAMIAGIWQKVLGVPDIGTQMNFFDLGGHSLLIIHVLSELRERVSRPVQMTDLFRYPTVETLARFITDGEAPASSLDRSRKRAGARRAALGRRRQE